MSTPRTSADIAAEIAELRAARTALVKGEQVKEVWRDGRRLIFAGASLKDIDASLAALGREYDGLVATEEGRPRRRPIRLVYG